MQHAIETLAASQFTIADHFQTFVQCVVAVANLTNDHLHKMGIVVGRVD